MGCKARVGERIRQDLAISMPVMLEVQKLLEEQWDRSDVDSRRNVAEIGAFFLITYCASLRGYETMKILLTTLRRGLVGPDEASQLQVQPHVVVPLKGRFKARSSQVQNLVLFVATETKSGLQPLLWARRLVNELERLHTTTGWLFQDERGIQRKMSHYSDGFFGLLLDVQEAKPNLMPDVKVMEDYGMARSLRRGATTQATKQGVSAADIDWVNRWNTASSDQVSGAPMRVLYVERKDIMDVYLKFSQAL